MPTSGRESTAPSKPWSKNREVVAERDRRVRHKVSEFGVEA